MNRGPYSFYCCLNRMSEFYDNDDMDYFFQNVRENDCDVNEAMKYLDMQTRTNYVTGVDPEPYIEYYLLNFLINNQFG